MLRTLSAALVAMVAVSGSVNAATILSGTFEVTVVNAKNLSSSESQATDSDYQAALAAAAGANPVESDTFTYIGDIDFDTSNSNDTTTIGDWLATGGGTVIGLDPIMSVRQLSAPSISAGTATTTFFRFVTTRTSAREFSIYHDDGVRLFDDLADIGGKNGPTGRTTTVLGPDASLFDGGQLDILYVATNGDPSTLNIEVTNVPLPASLPLLLAGFGGLAALRRRAS